jgi:hypothetical protein
VSLKCLVASKIAEPSLLFDRPCWLDQHAVLSLIAKFLIGMVMDCNNYPECTLTSPKKLKKASEKKRSLDTFTKQAFPMRLTCSCCL